MTYKYSKYLRIILNAPLMYFAKKGTYQEKDLFRTETAPTNSVIVGLSGNAKDIPRNDPRLSEMMQNYDIKYRRVLNDHKKRIKERYGYVLPQIFTDYQVADPEQNGNKIIKKVEYLCDEQFEVYIGAGDEELEELKKAFLNPQGRQGLYIGKKCCCNLAEPLINPKEKEQCIVLASELEGEKDVFDCIQN